MSAAALRDVSAARERLASLESEGARAFDPEGFTFIERLIAAGLEARATARLAKLELELDAERARLAEARARCAALDGALGADALAAEQRGALRLARRLATRTLRTLERARASATCGWALGLGERARTRAVRLSPDLSSRLAALESPRPLRSPEEARALAAELSRVMFDDSVSAVRATVALARAKGNRPEGAGPYNPRRIASEALGRVAELSPAYARALIASLDDLASLDALVPAPGPRAGRKRRS